MIRLVGCGSRLINLLGYKSGDLHEAHTLYGTSQERYDDRLDSCVCSSAPHGQAR